MEEKANECFAIRIPPLGNKDVPATHPTGFNMQGAEMDSVALIYLLFFNGAALKEVVCGCQSNI